jgi:hypothetical protein
MTTALLAAISLPGSIYPLRSAQKLVYFFTAELFYFVKEYRSWAEEATAASSAPWAIL